MSKASWTLMMSVKDELLNTLKKACDSNRIQLDEKQKTVLFELVGSAADAGYHKAYVTFEREAAQAELQVKEQWQSAGKST